jgi:flavin-dependent dehydrogenase
MIPFKDGDTSVGFVLEKSYTKVNRGQSRAEMYAQVLETLPALKEMLKDARPLIPVGSEANWSYKTGRTYDDRLLMVGDAAGFVDPLFSSGILLAVNAAKSATEHADAALRDGDFTAARFAAYEAQCARETAIFKSLITEFYAANLRRILLASAVNPTLCSILVSILAGDVSKPAIWHSAVTKAGFSNLAL